MAYPQTTFAHTTIDEHCLIGRRQKAVCANTLIYQLQVLKQTGRYDAFKLKWHPVYDEPPLVWPIPNHLFWDSDVAKWIEGACYFLKQHSLPEVEQAITELVEMIIGAQQEDGYLNIHYTVVQPGKRFSNLRDMHELYNCGHLIEAALAHHDLYHNEKLMRPILKYVDLLCQTFGPGLEQLHGYPGHPEIELALLRLYERTGDKKHLALARFFITERGTKSQEGLNYFDWESLKRGDDPAKRPAFYPEPRCLWYHQAHAPIAEQETIEGHSVRAMYLLTGAADLVRLDPQFSGTKLERAIYRLWHNMTQRKMYVTGGVGSIKQWEGFGQDYYLPQGTEEGGCYAETCASIGVMMLAQRLLQNKLDGSFADVMELCLFNTVLTSMSFDGKAFTYDNQLASCDADLSKRCDWFTVSCCPPNVSRLLGQIGGYAWSYNIDGTKSSASVVVHLYVASTLQFSVVDKDVRITQKTQYPWVGDIDFALSNTGVEVELKLRIPGWASSHTLEPPCNEATLADGYLTLPAKWLATHQSFRLSVPLKSRWIAQHPFTNQHTLSRARGPVIYCVEDFDNSWVNDHFKSVYLDHEGTWDETETTDDATGDKYVALTLHNGARRLDPKVVAGNPVIDAKHLQAQLEASERIETLKFVPYFFRANRGGKGHMRVGLKR
ncbi:hypothetical protein CKM354_000732500 [Cercospora kikuchii]|uniref:DUF1680-domain-containing protein n=1 Tax=Cercospora kikuchii TaxID=84275 RepID=A0A9P3FE68_9PEZI|nr:uncharacterized protein CKM354_000732500 [Cercospora kikuchii]GIZ44116.1 hypothetical protein CKM354_000732500 [Cercospora kikuchii]